MGNNIIAFTGDTSLEIDPDAILATCMGGFPGGVVVIGYNADGALEFRTSFIEARDFLWAIKNAEYGFMAEFGQ